MLVAQNNGDLFIINPVSETVSKRIIQLHNSPFIDYNEVTDTLISIGETGHGMEVSL